MQKVKYKKGDEVIVICGKHVDKKGKLIKVFPEMNRGVVQGVNRVKRHRKPTQKHPKGGILEEEKPLDLSNLKVICPQTGKPSRIGYKILESGEKVRIAKISGVVLDK